MPFENVNDALRQIDNEIAKGNYRTALGVCSSAITFFTPAPLESLGALKAKIKIIKALGDGSDRRIIDYRP